MAAAGATAGIHRDESTASHRHGERGAMRPTRVGSSRRPRRLWSIDLADKREPQLLFHHALVDVGEPILHTDRRLLGVRYDVERPYVWYADPKLRELIDRLDKQFPQSRP